MLLQLGLAVNLLLAFLVFFKILRNTIASHLLKILHWHIMILQASKVVIVLRRSTLGCPVTIQVFVKHLFSNQMGKIVQVYIIANRRILLLIHHRILLVLLVNHLHLLLLLIIAIIL